MSDYAKLPPTPADTKLRKKHAVDSFQHNMKHGVEHIQPAIEHGKGLAGVDPSKAKALTTGAAQTLHNLANQMVQGGTMADTTKKTGTTDGKSNALGGGGRFKQMTNRGVSPALAAYIGRKKYGAKGMAKLAAKGK